MQWYKNIWQPKRLHVVIIDIRQGDRSYNVYTVSKKDLQNLTPVEHKRFTSFTDVITACGKNTPYCLHLFGTGILSRKINFTPSFQNDLIVSGNKEDFAFTSYNDGVEVACSFFRKDLLQEELELVKEQKLYVHSTTSGMVPGFTLLENEGISFDFTIGLDQGRIVDFNKSDTAKDKELWKGQFYSRNVFIALAVVNSCLNEDEHFSMPDVELISKSKDEFYQFNQFRTYGIGVVGVILFALLGNYFYQNHLNDVIAQLETDLSLQNENLSLMDRLDQEIIRKKQLMQDAGVGSSRFISYYLDEIGVSVPGDIKLTDLIVFPVEGKLKNKKKVEILKNRIEVSGVTNGNIILDDWIEKLDRNEWVISIELVNYQKDKNGAATFKLTLITK